MTVYFSLPAGTDWAAMRDVARHRAPLYEDMAALRSKSWVMDVDQSLYGGHYVWESSDAAEAFLGSELFQGFVAKFGAPKISTYEVVACVERGTVVATPDDTSTSRKGSRS